jgi:hypothetical protein
VRRFSLVVADRQEASMASLRCQRLDEQMARYGFVISSTLILDALFHDARHAGPARGVDTSGFFAVAATSRPASRPLIVAA